MDWSISATPRLLISRIHWRAVVERESVRRVAFCLPLRSSRTPTPNCGRSITVCTARSTRPRLSPLTLPPTGGPIELDNTAQLVDIFSQGDPDLAAHFPSGFVGTKAHEPHDLQWADTFVAGQHKMNESDDLIPVPQRLFCVLKDSAGKVREAITGLWSAFVTLPSPGASLELVRAFSATTRATNAIGPTPCHKVSAASIFVRKHRLELGGGELINRLWLLAGHDVPISAALGQIAEGDTKHALAMT